MSMAFFHLPAWLRPVLALVVLLSGGGAGAATLDQAESALRRGDYEECVRLCGEGIAADQLGNEDWHLFRIEAQLALGRYDAAWTSLQKGLQATRERSVRLYWLGREVAQFQDQPQMAQEYVDRIDSLFTGQTRFHDPEDLAAFGRTALQLGMEPKAVLSVFYDPGLDLEPPLRNSVLAAGRLALDKEDFRVAGEVFAKGFEAYEEDPDILYGYARAVAGADYEESQALITLALDANPRHMPSLLLVAERAIDAEDYDGAREALDAVLGINKDHPYAWAYRAVLAHLDSDPEGEAQARSRALAHWSANPGVDHLIGSKLSRSYRFREGAEYQRRALELDPSYGPAKLQLGQDLLRLGAHEEGWSWIRRSHDHDGYNQTAYNLIRLKDTLDGYATLENDYFLIRMPAEEAPVFGQRLMDLMEEAREVLCERYQVDLEERTVLELYDRQNHFAVRTFGMPHNPGFLGVCFGNVITANSPSTQRGSEVNWEAVMWHEYCHVVTLAKTRNRMPRWLSEGISVYEETVRDPSWGQSMTPSYRERIVSGRITPVSRLSSAFLQAESGEDMQFAYFQSSLVVRYLVEKWGMEALLAILSDLGEGTAINDALARNTVPIGELDGGFAQWALEEAQKLGPGLGWEALSEEATADIPPGDLLSLYPDNYYLLLGQAGMLAEEGRWEEARVHLDRILESWPVEPGNREAPMLLAQCLRELGLEEEERALMRQIAKAHSGALPVYWSLLRWAEEEEGWPEVRQNLERIWAVDPLSADSYRLQARLEEAEDRELDAIGAWRRVLHFEPPDPGNVHYQMARLMHRNGIGEAHGHILQALEEAPRFRDAYRLLRRIKGLPLEVQP